MARAARTARRFGSGGLSWDTLQAVIDEHNLGIAADHDVAALLDADVGVTATDYETNLTALEIPYTDVVLDQAAGAVPRFNDEFPVGLVSDDIVKALVQQYNARVTDIRTAIAALNADGAITSTSWAKASQEIDNLIRTFGETGIEQDAVAAILELPNLPDNAQNAIDVNRRGRRWTPGDLLAITEVDSGSSNLARVLRSVDGGLSWYDIATIPATMVTTVGAAVSPVTGTIIVAGTTATTVVVYKSVDGGHTWTVADDAGVGSVFNGETALGGVFCDSNGVFYIGGATDAEVFRSASDDDADVWTEADTLGAAALTTSFGETKEGVILAGADDAILYSSADGVTFAAEEDFSAGADEVNAILGWGPEGYIYVITSETLSLADLRVSQDAMATWEAAVSVGAVAEFRHITQANGIVYIADASDDVYHSDDAGATIEATPAVIGGETSLDVLLGTRGGRVLVGSRDTTNFGRIYLLESADAALVWAFGETGDAGEHLFSLTGVSGRLLEHLRLQHNLLSQNWQDLCGKLDTDGDVGTTTYEAQLTADHVTVLPVGAVAP
jgi:hypothetical protein